MQIAFVNLEKIEPREKAGSMTQARFSYQGEFIAHQCVEMLGDSTVLRVFCDYHSDCVVEGNDNGLTYYQVKGLKNKLLTPSYFLNEALPDMFSNYVNANGKCKSFLATNAPMNSELKEVMVLKRNKVNDVANASDLQKLSNLISDWRQSALAVPAIERDYSEIVKLKDGLFDKFMLEFEIMDELPTFSEDITLGKKTLRDFNLLKLKTILDKAMGIGFVEQDVEEIYEMIENEVKYRSQLETRYNRYITRDMLFEKLKIPSYKKIYFDKSYEKEADKLENQSVLVGKLEKGKFDQDYIQNAKLVRCVTKYIRSELSKMNATAKLIDDFEYRLVNICLDVLEDHRRRSNGSLDAWSVFKDLESKLIQLARDQKYEKLCLDVDFVKGLIWEATSECKIRWA